MSDSWYIEGLNIRNDAAEREHQVLTDDGTQKLVAAGLGDVAQSYDVGAMQAAGVPMDGTVEPRFANKGSRMVGHFDAATGQNMASVTASPASLPNDFATRYGEMLTQAYGSIGEFGATPEEAYRTAITSLYEFGAGIWNFSADVTEWLTDDKPLRVESAEAKGLAPKGGLNRTVAAILPFVMGFTGAYRGLTKLAGQPRSFFARTAQSMAAGAGTDFVLADPREDSLLQLMTELFDLQHASLQEINPAEFYKTAGPMAGRLGMAAEGVAVGSMVSGLMGLGKRIPGAAVLGMSLFGQADAVEQEAVSALSQSRAHVREGMDETDAGWLTVWMGAKIMKGAKRLNGEIAEQASAWHATASQLEAAWNRAARIAQEASKRTFAKATEGRADGR